MPSNRGSSVSGRSAATGGARSVSSTGNSGNGTSKRKQGHRVSKLRHAVETTRGVPLAPQDCAGTAQYHHTAFPFEDMLCLTIPIRSIGQKAPLTPADELLGDLCRDDGSEGLTYAILLVVLSYITVNLAEAASLSHSVFARVNPAYGTMNRSTEIINTVAAATADTHEEAARRAVGVWEPPMPDVDFDFMDEDEDSRGAIGMMEERQAFASSIEFARPTAVSIIVEFTYDTPKEVREVMEGGGAVDIEAPEQVDVVKATNGLGGISRPDVEELKSEGRAMLLNLGFTGEYLDGAVEEFVQVKMAEWEEVNGGPGIGAAATASSCVEDSQQSTVPDFLTPGTHHTDGNEGSGGAGVPTPLEWDLREQTELIHDAKEDLVTRTTEDHLTDAKKILARIRQVGEFLKTINLTAKTTRSVQPVPFATAMEYNEVETKCVARVTTLEAMVKAGNTAHNIPVRGISKNTGTFAEEITGITIYVLNNSDVDVSDIMATLLAEHTTERHSRSDSLVSDKLHVARQDLMAQASGGGSGGPRRSRHCAMSMTEARHGASDDAFLAELSHARTHSSMSGGGGGGARKKNGSTNLAVAAQRAASDKARKKVGHYAAGTIDYANWVEVASQYSIIDRDSLSILGPNDLSDLLYKCQPLDPRSIFSLKNALRHRNNLCAPCQSYDRFRATGGRSMLLGGSGGRTEYGCGYVYFAMPVTCMPPTEV